MDLHRLGAALGLVQQSTQPDGGGLALSQQLQQITQGVPGVQDVLHHDDVLSGDVAGEVLGDLDLTGGGGAGAIGGHGHKVHSAGQVDPAAQVRHKDEGAAQDTDEDDLLPLVVLGDLPGDLIHPAGQLLLAEEDLLNIFFQHNTSSFPHNDCC